MLALDQRNFAKRDGHSQFVSHLDVDSYFEREDKLAPIAIGWERDLLFKVDVNRLEASDTQDRGVSEKALDIAGITAELLRVTEAEQPCRYTKKRAERP
ncbi:uncharacterized protein V6R79_016713 [Siganus canaliculatus]